MLLGRPPSDVMQAVRSARLYWEEWAWDLRQRSGAVCVKVMGAAMLAMSRVCACTSFIKESFYLALL